VVGCLGYPDDRRPGRTPVYALHLSDFHIAEVPTTGQAPGWVFQHEATAQADGLITIQGGEVIEEREGQRRNRRNVELYALDTRSGTWRRLTDRNWPQFRVRREDYRLFPYNPDIKPQQILPRTVDYVVLPCDEWKETRIAVEGIPVSVTTEMRHVEILVEGVLPEDLTRRLVEDIRANTEAAVQAACVLE
ncbi:MAG: hypothetical protein J2P46_16135, partial [Zavarzinella sp.]|nr:hypothetical protein [Zavarzinella sp.]